MNSSICVNSAMQSILKIGSKVLQIFQHLDIYFPIIPIQINEYCCRYNQNLQKYMSRNICFHASQSLPLGGLIGQAYNCPTYKKTTHIHMIGNSYHITWIFSTWYKDWKLKRMYKEALIEFQKFDFNSPIFGRFENSLE